MILEKIKNKLYSLYDIEIDSNGICTIRGKVDVRHYQYLRYFLLKDGAIDIRIE